MDFPFQVSFRHTSHIEAVAEDARARAEHLATFYDRIVSCRVAIERPHHHHERGNRYRVRIEIAVPGDVLVIDHGADLHDAFDAARRRLQDYARRRRGHVKDHEMTSSEQEQTS